MKTNERQEVLCEIYSILFMVRIVKNEKKWEFTTLNEKPLREKFQRKRFD
jgi:uncharacterized protein Veg